MFLNSRLKRRSSLTSYVKYLKETHNVDIEDTPFDFDVTFPLPIDDPSSKRWGRILFLTPSMTEPRSELLKTIKKVQSFVSSAGNLRHAAIFILSPDGFKIRKDSIEIITSADFPPSLDADISQALHGNALLRQELDRDSALKMLVMDSVKSEGALLPAIISMAGLMNDVSWGQHAGVRSSLKASGQGLIGAASRRLAARDSLWDASLGERENATVINTLRPQEASDIDDVQEPPTLLKLVSNSEPLKPPPCHPLAPSSNRPTMSGSGSVSNYHLPHSLSDTGEVSAKATIPVPSFDYPSEIPRDWYKKSRPGTSQRMGFKENISPHQIEERSSCKEYLKSNQKQRKKETLRQEGKEPTSSPQEDPGDVRGLKLIQSNSHNMPQDPGNAYGFALGDESHQPGRSRLNNRTGDVFASNFGSVSAAMELLPFCTTQAKLNSSEVVSLSDAAGSLRELVLLALKGKLDEHGKDVLDATLGVEMASHVRDFWTDEWVVD